MSKNKTSGNLPGQQAMDINAARTPAPTVKPIVPPKPGTVAPAQKETPKTEAKEGETK